jgi:ligand-binding sensor domain-containing protein/signal transduction histidine kinase/CheY-like chemotaxis protein/AraC-like DNA-binding protein
MPYFRSHIRCIGCVLLISFLFFHFAEPVACQPRETTFQSIQKGLSRKMIKCIYKDSRGFMWFGTDDGLNLYDGVSFTIFENTPDDPGSISNSDINAIAEDSGGRLWIGTAKGLNLFDREHFSFLRISDTLAGEQDIARMYINSIYIDSDSAVWIGTLGGGLIIYNPEENSFVYRNELDGKSIRSNFVTCLLPDALGNIWIGTWKGLDCFEKRTLHFIHFSHDPDDPESLGGIRISSLAMDKSGTLWIGMQGYGLDRINKQDNRIVFDHYRHNNSIGSISNDYILSLCFDHSGNLWVGTENGGLNLLPRQSEKFKVYIHDNSNPNSIRSNSIWSLMEDDAGILWIGTYNKGINTIDKKASRFELYQCNNFTTKSLGNNDVTCFAEDFRGNIWIGTDGGGLSYFDPETREIVRTIKNTDESSALVNNAIMCLLTDRNNNIWVGTWAGGIDLLDSNGKRLKNYSLRNSNGTGDNNILTLFLDSHNTVWAGTAGSGVFHYDRIKDTFLKTLVANNPNSTIPNAIITSIAEDTDHSYWLGTLYGLLHIKESGPSSYSFTSYYHSDLPSSLPSNRVNALFIDHSNTLWLGTEDQGLARYDRNQNTFTSLPEQNEMPNNSIKGILEDSKGHLWISTNKGIFSFDHESHIIQCYNTDDGLNSDEFYSRSCLRSHSGDFYFGGNNGFNLFQPDSFHINSSIPPVYITDFKLFDRQVSIGGEGSPLKRHISETEKITLTHKQNSFTIDFVALNYTLSFKNQYACILEGFDKEWIKLGNIRSVTYSNLKPGSYTFRVKGSNNDGVWNNNPRVLKIRILPPWWKTGWAYGAYILLFLLTMWAFISLLMIRAKQAHSLKLERMKREKDEELSNMKMQFFTNISHEFRTPLSLILSPLETIMESSQLKSIAKEQLTVIRRNAERLFRLVNELMDIQKISDRKLKLKIQQGDMFNLLNETIAFFSELIHRKRVDFITYVTMNENPSWFDRDKLEKVFFNLISNALKFVPEYGKVNIHASVKSITEIQEIIKAVHKEWHESTQFLFFQIANNGKVIDPGDLPYIFDRFFQGKNAENKKHSGTGVGLALTKNLVELHHGVIYATNVQDETQFTFFIPINRSEYPDDEIDITPMDIAHIDPHGHIDSYQEIEEEVSPSVNNNGYNVLIIEDNNDLRAYLARELRKEFLVSVAKDGAAGIAKAFKMMPDIIISDILMPVADGIQVCKTLKNDLRTSHIPIILLTARTAVEHQIEGAEAGADSYIAKPFNIRYLLAQIRSLIDSRLKVYAHFSHSVYLAPDMLANNTLDKDFISSTIDYIVKNLSNTQLGVESLADFSNLSRSQVYRKIKTMTGKSAVEFIRVIRLKEALKLMETKKYSLSEIAYETGFNSPSYFTRSFKDQFGKAPSDYLSN